MIAIRRHQRFELPVALGDDAELVGIGGGLGVGEARLEFTELIGHSGQSGGHTWIEHGPRRLPGRVPSRS